MLRAAAPRVRPVADDIEVGTRPGRRRGPAAQPGARAAPAPRLPTGTRCWSRCRGAATSRRWPAPATARRRAARSAPGRWRPPANARSRPAGGAGGRRGTGAARAAAGGELRAMVVGAGRTAEELGRAFPGRAGAVRQRRPPARRGRARRRRWSSRRRAPSRPVRGGYGAALLLDGWALLSRADLRAAEETLRRWANAAALVRPGGAGRRRRRRRAARRPGAGPLGSGRLRRPRARRTGRARFPAGDPDGRSHRATPGPGRTVVRGRPA